MNRFPYKLVDLTNDFSYETTFCPICETLSDLESSQAQALTTGLSFAHCGDIAYQVVQCHTPGCRGQFVFRFLINSPALDIQGMLLMPYVIHPAEFCEQCDHFMPNPPIDWPDQLKFQLTRDYYSYTCVKMDEQTFWQALEKERVSGQICLKRLYPNKHYYQDLFMLFPDYQIGFDNDQYEIIHKHISKIDNQQLKNAIFSLLYTYTGKSIHKQITNKLESKGYIKSQVEADDISWKTINILIDRQINEKKYFLLGNLYQIINT